MGFFIAQRLMQAARRLTTEKNMPVTVPASVATTKSLDYLPARIRRNDKPLAFNSHGFRIQT